jgi:O-antigen ligase
MRQLMSIQRKRPGSDVPHRKKQVGAVSGPMQDESIVFGLLIIYLVFDFIRPSFVWQFPKIISVILVIAWITKASKVWCPQLTSYVCFLGVMTIGIPLASNTYEAVWTTYGMLMLLVGVCAPLINFTDSIGKLRRLIHWILGIFLYMAVYAIFNDGFGPAGTEGGQDENYVAAALNLVIPLALFLFFAEKKIWKKAIFGTIVCLYLLAIVVGLSRGGFVGLLCGLGFFFLKSPTKGTAILATILILGFLGVVAGAAYWEEMSTITDTSKGTADLRFEFWEIAVREFLAYPLTGVGPNNYRWRTGEFMSAEQLQKFGRILVSHVHSTYFQLLAEMGVAGFLVFGFFLHRTYHDYRVVDQLHGRYHAPSAKHSSVAEEDFRWMQIYARGLMAGIIGYLASVAFLSSLYYSHLWIAGSMMAALYAIAMKRINEKDCVPARLSSTAVRK